MSLPKRGTSEKIVHYASINNIGFRTNGSQSSSRLK
jgi:hypothetical protein